MIGTTGLRSLRIDCVVGVYPFEREAPQPLVLDIELDYDFAGAAETDEVEHAVDYDRVAEAVTELAQRRRFRLLETFSEEAAALLLADHPVVRTVRIEIRKPNAVPAADGSYVRVERSRR